MSCCAVRQGRIRLRQSATARQAEVRGGALTGGGQAGWQQTKLESPHVVSYKFNGRATFRAFSVNFCEFRSISPSFLKIMEIINDNQNMTLKPEPALARKRVPSRLDPFTDQLLQMDTDQKTLGEMMEWLKTQQVETVASNLSTFLASRRRRRAHQEQLNIERDALESYRDWSQANPKPTLEGVSDRLKMLALSLSLTKEPSPEILRLAERLAGTASRMEYRTRKLVIEEHMFEEWKKDDEVRALELFFKEADKYPEISKMFTAALVALQQAKPK